MIKKNCNYWGIVISVILFSAVLYFVIGAVVMDKRIGKLHYSSSLQEAKKEETFINKYFVYDRNGKQISNAWLEYARSYNIFDDKKIEKNKMLLSVKDIKKFDEIKDVYWEAFSKDKKLTAFEEKDIVSVVGVDKNMDTIKLKPNRDETFYIVKD